MPQWPWHDRVNLDRMRRERVQKLRDRMERDGIGAYLCFNPDNVLYLTDCYPGLAGRLMLSRNVLLPRNGDPILFEWGSRWQRVRDELAPWLKGQVKPGWRLYFYLARGIYPDEFMADLKKTLSEHDLLGEPVAVDMPIVTLDFAEVFGQGGVKLFPKGHGPISEVRSVKTQDEIGCQRVSAAICDQVFAAMRDAIAPGVRECDVQRVGTDAAMRLGVDFPPDFVLCSGENTRPNMGGYSDRPLRAGDMLFIDLPTIQWHGYRICEYRTFTVGRASTEQHEAHQECRELAYRAIARIRPGATTADICGAWPPPEHWGARSWREISDCAIGHGIGITPQEPPAITPLFSMDYPVVLEENMVIAIETWYPTRGPRKEGARFEETLLVTGDGHEILTTWPGEKITEAWT